MSVWRLQLVRGSDSAELGKVVLIPRCLSYPCTTHSLSLWQAWQNETSLFCATTVVPKHFFWAMRVSTGMLMQSCCGLQPSSQSWLLFLQNCVTWQHPYQCCSDASPALEIMFGLLVSYVQLGSHQWTWCCCSWRLLQCLFDPTPGFLVPLLC